MSGGVRGVVCLKTWVWERANLGNKDRIREHDVDMFPPWITAPFKNPIIVKPLLGYPQKKITCPQKWEHFNRKFHFPPFSGIILVFRGLMFQTAHT